MPPTLTPQQGDAYRRVEALLSADQGAEALKACQGLITETGQTTGLPYLLGLCLDRVGRHEEALTAYGQELSLDPNHAEARARFDQLSQALARPVPQRLATHQRTWNTSLPRETLLRIQQSLHNYTYRGVPMLKNPFDFALYPLLLWNLKPRTLIEIGSKSGGSALWFGDLLNDFGVDGHVYSLDIVRVDSVSHPRVTFLEANGRALERTLTTEFLERLPRPWLVIEDADHSYETSSAALRFFHPWLRPGEYIVIEDGIISDLTQDPAYGSGPHRALKEFLAAHAGEYEIDGDYCDFFGYNLTWCTNGFLKRVGRAADGGPGELPAERSLKAGSPGASLSGDDPDLTTVARLMEERKWQEAFRLLNGLKARAARLPKVDYFRALYFVNERDTGAAIEALKEELRFFPGNTDAARLLKKLVGENPAPVSQGDAEFRELASAIRPYTMLSEARLLSLYTLARRVCEEDLPGNFVECGVAAGGSSGLLAAVLQRHSRQPRRLVAFDTFAGMPPTGPHDTHHGRTADDIGWGAGTCAAPEASVREICRKLGAEAMLETVPGLFSATLPANRQRIGEIALLHMDGDWYESTLAILENLFENVVPGGRIQIDDYGHWEGCKKAVDEFAQHRQLHFGLQRIDETGVWFRK